MSLIDRTLVRALPVVPRGIVRRISSHYIAGETVEDAITTARELDSHGKLSTVDVLGEEIASVAEAGGFVDAYLEVLDALDREGLEANVSVKPTALGLGLDDELCASNIEAIVARSGELGGFVRIDMEDSSTTDATLGIYRDLRRAGHDNVGPVLQACLRRTADDVRELAPLQPSVRLCKGIYVEPEAVAYQGFEEVQASYVESLELLLGAGCYVGMATHDEHLIGEGLRLVGEHGLAPSEYEFQMLLGVTERRAAELVADGHRLRVYVPFGERWYEYSIRRLQENPRVARYIAWDTFERFVPRRHGT